MHEWQWQVTWRWGGNMNTPPSDCGSLRLSWFSFLKHPKENRTVVANCTATPNTNMPRSANRVFVRLISNCWLAESSNIVVVNTFWSLVIWNITGLFRPWEVRSVREHTFEERNHLKQHLWQHLPHLSSLHSIYITVNTIRGCSTHQRVG